MVRACSTYGSDEKCIEKFDRKPEGKRPLGRSSNSGKVILKWIVNK